MIDLHVHSTASDGTFSPTELARQGRDFSVMALTDHDNCDGVDEFLCECQRLNSQPPSPRWRGVERGAGGGV